jgi:hypothetical protein
MFMRALRVLSTFIAVSFATVAIAADFDGSVPLTCTVHQTLDCLPTKTSCDAMKPENNIAPVVGIDFAKKQIRSPYRKGTLPVLTTTKNADSLVLQGADLLLAWSALVDKKTGALTIALADSEGAYVYFGTCKADKK